MPNTREKNGLLTLYAERRTTGATIKGTGNGQWTNVIGNSFRVKNVTMIQVKSILMPNMFDNITDYNNKLEINGVVYTIPPAYYTLAELMTTLTTLTGKTWTATTGSNPRVTVSNPGGPLKIYEGLATVLGANPDIYYLPGGPITFAEPPNVLGPQIVHVECPQLATGNHINWEGKSHNIVETVSMAETLRGSYLYYHQAGIPNQLDFHFPRELSTLEFRLLDHLFRPIDLPSTYSPYIQLHIWSTDN